MQFYSENTTLITLTGHRIVNKGQKVKAVEKDNHQLVRSTDKENDELVAATVKRD